MYTNHFINRIEDWPYLDKEIVGAAINNNEKAVRRFFPSNMNKRGHILFSVRKLIKTDKLYNYLISPT